jgi:DNA-binding MarR family transcriptional regulator
MKSGQNSLSKAALAAEAWRELFDFFIASRKERDPVIAKAELTPNDAKGLYSLSMYEGKTMGALASEWTCDASNATWIVDRLEKRGLAERRPAPGDRRVKMVVLTPLGQKTRDMIMAAFHEPPAAVLSLSRKDLEALHAIAGRLTARAREIDGSPVPASEQPA